MASITSPLRGTYRYLQRQAHESPVIFFSLIIGLSGPVIAITVPPIRRRMGWRPAEQIPTTYPLPKRARVPVQGYDDE
ncbi:uncharacterized protein LAESUDRAFT_660510 [Laetiporus sulphureus 93-53]|uniref:NADH-ubiquinone oxidoreductase 9.5 kDa subunit n=1 Tax=Laetiporus sulphureus 93-53 TaxID=1314785 RepID=A0A165CLT3_9APHY|nr:uncharacterized protein LAESUDRAFT_660510 [Laetiporus sulphureus 93-53]KZT03039.1 hypothetical protein LAESUDRAFT_660510 [Laetiporus sulphureus 93-53]